MTGPDPAALPGGRTVLQWPSLAERRRFEDVLTAGIKTYAKHIGECEPRFLRARVLLCMLHDAEATRGESSGPRPAKSERSEP